MRGGSPDDGGGGIFVVAPAATGVVAFPIPAGVGHFVTSAVVCVSGGGGGGGGGGARCIAEEVDVVAWVLFVVRGVATAASADVVADERPLPLLVELSLNLREHELLCFSRLRTRTLIPHWKGQRTRRSSHT